MTFKNKKGVLFSRIFSQPILLFYFINNIRNYPFGEESIVNIDNSANQSNDEKYYLEIFCVHFK